MSKLIDLYNLTNNQFMELLVNHMIKLSNGTDIKFISQFVIPFLSLISTDKITELKNLCEKNCGKYFDDIDSNQQFLIKFKSLLEKYDKIILNNLMEQIRTLILNDKSYLIQLLVDTNVYDDNTRNINMEVINNENITSIITFFIDEKCLEYKFESNIEKFNKLLNFINMTENETEIDISDTSNIPGNIFLQFISANVLYFTGLFNFDYRYTKQQFYIYYKIWKIKLPTLKIHSEFTYPLNIVKNYEKIIIISFMRNQHIFNPNLEEINYILYKIHQTINSPINAIKNTIDTYYNNLTEKILDTNNFHYLIDIDNIYNLMFRKFNNYTNNLDDKMKTLPKPLLDNINELYNFTNQSEINLSNLLLSANDDDKIKLTIAILNKCRENKIKYNAIFLKLITIFDIFDKKIKKIFLEQNLFLKIVDFSENPNLTIFPGSNASSNPIIIKFTNIITILNSLINLDFLENQYIIGIICYIIEKKDWNELLTKKNNKKFKLLKKINEQIIINIFSNKIDYFIFDLDKLSITCSEKEMQGMEVKCKFKQPHMFVKDNKMSMQNVVKLCNYDPTNEEQQKYLDEFLYVEILPCDMCYHSCGLFPLFGNIIPMKNSTTQQTQYGVYYYCDKFLEDNKESIYYWKQNLIGGIEYGGGWFTYNQHYSGPTGAHFGLYLGFKVLESVPFLFIPPIYDEICKDQEENPKYFETTSNIDTISDTDTNTDKIIKNYINTSKWSGSHIFEGVENWKSLGYNKIDHPLATTFADNFTKKILSLGFNGYVSCDECEMFINFKTQAKYLDKTNISYEISDYWMRQFGKYLFSAKLTKSVLLDKIKTISQKIIPDSKIPEKLNRASLHSFQQKSLKVLHDIISRKITYSSEEVKNTYSENIHSIIPTNAQSNKLISGFTNYLQKYKPV